MQFQVLYLLAAAALAVAMPATTSSITISQSQGPAAHAAVIAKLAETHKIVKPKKTSVKTVKTMNIDLGQCLTCYQAVEATISNCEPVLDGFSGWFHIPTCISQIVGDFSALTDDCIPCLESLV